MRKYRPILNFYLARQYAGTVALFLLSIATIIALFDAIELVRRASKIDAFDFSLVSYLALLKIPGNIITISPFAILFAAIFTLSSLTRRQELVVLRTAGASIWQLLTPLFVVAFIYGALITTIINPLSATTQSKYQEYEERYLRKEQHMIALLNQGLWLRQGQQDGGYLLMHSRKVKVTDWALDDVFVLFFDANYGFQRRLDAAHAHLSSGAWVLDDVSESSAGQIAQLTPTYEIPTDLSRKDIEDSFSTPETVSFWSMPAFIELIRSTGLSVVSLQIHFGGLLMLPFLCAGLVTIAAAVTIRPPRAGGQMKMAILGIFLGFVVFFLTNFLHALGSSAQIPVILSVCAPAFLTFAGGIMALLALEDQ